MEDTQAGAATPGPGAARQGDTALSLKRRAMLLMGASIVLAVGLFLGYLLAYTASQGGVSGGLGATLLFIAYAAVIGLLAVLGLVAATFARSRRFGTGALAAAGILVIGALAGFAVTPELDLGYHEPITLRARGIANAQLDGNVAFIPREPGRATCRSEPGGDTMSNVELDLGHLGPGLLHGSVSVSEAGSSEAWVELRADSADDVDGVYQPEWIGTGEVTDLGERGTSGRVAFQDLRPGSETRPRSPAEIEDWPATLSGSLSWVCG